MNKKLVAKVESVLFAAAKIVKLEELMHLCNAPKKEIKDAIKELKKKLNSSDSPLEVIEFKDAYKLTLKDEYMPLAEKVIKDIELPKSVLETLAVIAFKHPIQQNELVKIRSNKAYDHLDRLEAMGFIKRSKIGRTKKIELTQKFFEYFDVPPDKIKDAFATYAPVEKKIEAKEVELEKIQEEIKIREQEKGNEEDIDIDIKVYHNSNYKKDEKEDGEKNEDSKKIPKIQIIDVDVKERKNIKVLTDEYNIPDKTKDIEVPSNVVREDSNKEEQEIISKNIKEDLKDLNLELSDLNESPLGESNQEINNHEKSSKEVAKEINEKIEQRGNALFKGQDRNVNNDDEKIDDLDIVKDEIQEQKKRLL